MSEAVDDSRSTERPPASTLERVLRADKFAVTAELVPPRTPTLGGVDKKIAIIKDISDAINITDNASASVKMSSLSVCIHVVQQGGEPVFQTTSRDRNRLALQADLIGGYALGIRNVFAISGDYVTMGDHPASKPVYDMDSVQVLQMFDGIRNGKFESGIEVRATPRTPLHTPNIFLGAAANPFADPMPMHVIKTAKKALAGADFIQSQCTFDIPRLREFMKMYVDRGLHERLKFLVGVMPCKSCRPLEFMATSVPGMRIPNDLITRMKGAEDPVEEGIKVAVETIEEVRTIEGIDGIHLMTVSWEDVIPEILTRTKLMPEDRGVTEIYAEASAT
jgi:methylenetetrahydrofolate reductase (NADPH)